MKLQPVYIIEELEQLKTISDPLRAKVLLYLIEKAYTGQQLAKLLGMARAKVHYHLNELEKHGLISVIRTELKNGIVQKFYRAVARGFVPSEALLPYVSEVENYYRERTLSVLARARRRAINAPEEAFQIPSADRAHWPIIMTQVEVKMSKEKYAEWLRKFRALIFELDSQQEENGEWFYLTTVGFQTNEPSFDPVDEVEKK
ncbi:MULTISPECIES: helix-turn-helix domain-containing protein [Paenibacillus]|uniref:Helix-turn-helix domain-containing protein n=3 Tax=Paenibacillus TaxID=44249 RepID=A0ABU6DHW4_9BACL|nr:MULTISPECIES: helix-turn-helix domain-containing protein [Paenibacillus]MBA2943032.1 helix-turn-helix transcriptional regulator [Paenibacillus sp. CGMCC 1.16610]MCY9657647.1 helix-turn-helix domain-containing protein [Paenibacillus anseongense]MEB4797354.1 helix-turn-helix domain-containing protein [Paenibacillus chondroitinus]MVQ33528.1 helix-turn-helix domain-containing protein [Paenibacillus anseongense]